MNPNFHVAALGDAPLRYQWRFNGSEVPGATNESLVLSDLQNNQAGDYDVVVSNLFGSLVSEAARLRVLTPPSITVQPVSRKVHVGSAAGFSVEVEGSGPFTYQWQFNGSDLVGQTSASLEIPSVQLSQAGDYAVRVANAAGVVESALARLEVLGYTNRVVQIVSVAGVEGGSVSVPVALLAMGDESAVSFSLGFDQTSVTFTGVAEGSDAPGATINVNTNQATNGWVGLLVSLSTGATFNEATQEIVRLNFQVSADSGDIAVPLRFGDAPVRREVSDVGARPLPAAYLDGEIRIGTGYEGDVTPLPNGNGAVTITDWVKVGRYAAQLDSATNRIQFQRADCAPRDILGNGAITLTDWVQAGRYAAGLDPLTLVGGPTEPQAGLLAQKSAGVKRPAVTAPGRNRVVRVAGLWLQPGQTNVVPVQLLAQGNESALGFSLSFNTSALSYLSASPGSNATGGTLNVNTNQLPSGRLGIALSLPIGTTFAAGTEEVVKVRFAVPTAATGNTTLAFTDQPVRREISDLFANELPGTYEDCTLSLGADPGKRLRLQPPQLQPAGHVRLLIGNADGSGLESQRVSRIEILATTNVAWHVTNWLKLTNPLVWTNGLLRLDDSNSVPHPSRFYDAVEKP